jgi:hypothetical protein
VSIDSDIARRAAEQANKLFGQWMPERWLSLFIDSYDDIEACREADAPTLQQPSRNDLIVVREALKAVLALFDDEGNMTCTFDELQKAVLEGYDVLGKTRLSYEIKPDGGSELSSHHQNTGE